MQFGAGLGSKRHERHDKNESTTKTKLEDGNRVCSIAALS